MEIPKIIPKNIDAWKSGIGTELNLRFSEVPGRSHYEIEIAPADNPTDIRIIRTYKTRLRIKGLQPGTEYGINVMAVMMDEVPEKLKW
jgi:hypothetical protein